MPVKRVWDYIAENSYSLSNIGLGSKFFKKKSKISCVEFWSEIK